MKTKLKPVPVDVLVEIAKQHLRIETLDARNSDSLDFHDCAVWSIRDALEAAFRAGASFARRR